ncbi:MAG: hypothetical protein ACSHW7_02190 [Patiriisocius sp.]|uniref:hypothetical protein n=1 Tax=Patiriisocius sp. TaxID=2822396 RepID=UPI003EF32992
MDFSYCGKEDLKLYIEVFIINNYYDIKKWDEDEDTEVNDKILEKIVLLKESVSNLIDSLRDLCFLIEYPYTDKLYRDAYSRYFSTLNKNYSRDTIRISLFTKDSLEIFKNDLNTELLNLPANENFLGYFIIRPTYPAEYCRSFINPKAFKNLTAITCLSEGSALIEGKEYSTLGFPHASQDGIVHSCSETAIWVLMEYFGSKYNYYGTTLPSVIHKILRKISFQRLIPSKGMAPHHISFTLRKFGFGSLTYTNTKYKEDFKFIINDYIESGIPIIVITQKKNKTRRHAFLMIGHTESESGDYIESDTLENTTPFFEFKRERNDSDQTLFSVIDSASFSERSYIIMDDNKPPYQQAKLDVIGSYYGKGHDMAKDSELMAIIVPLYPKIYLDAVEARNLFKTIIKNEVYGWNYLEHTTIISRLFLTSSRSYKKKIRSYIKNIDLIKILLNQIMPKFIYICEISTPEYYENKESLGFHIFDSTASKFDNVHSSLIAIVYPDRIYINKDGVLRPKTLKVLPFPLYENNLKKN